MRRRAVLVALGIACATSLPAHAETAPLESAIESYTRALHTRDRDARIAAFRVAERGFGAAVAAGALNPAILTNQGNAALQGERIGHAILAYRRALLLEPAHPRARQNLDHARGLLPAWVPRPEPAGLLDSFFFWHRTVARAQRGAVATGCFLLVGVLAALGIRLRQPPLRNAALVPLLVWAGLMLSVVFDPAAHALDEAVVTADEAIARAADSPLAKAALAEPLPGGTELTVLERRPPWLRVRLANGRDAWLAQDAVTALAPEKP
jgi:hypothetical protein